MLEIIGQILCAMLLLKGVDFIMQSFNRTPGSLATPLAWVAAVLCFITAAYFYNMIDNQASGARRAVEDIQKQADDQREQLYKQFGQ